MADPSGAEPSDLFTPFAGGSRINFPCYYRNSSERRLLAIFGLNRLRSPLQELTKQAVLFLTERSHPGLNPAYVVE